MHVRRTGLTIIKHVHEQNVQQLILLTFYSALSLSVFPFPPFLCRFIMHTVPIQITSHPPGETDIYNNTQKTLSVDFHGRVGQDIQITWEKDGRPLPTDYQVTTTYNSLNSPPTGRTTLGFSTIQRKDSGVYRVVFNSTLGARCVPSHLLTGETCFQVNVIGKCIRNICSRGSSH